MEVLTLEQAGVFAWSNSKKTKSLFATASIYDPFSSSDTTQDEAVLQLYSLDIVNKTSSSQKLGYAKMEGLQFSSLNWHDFGESEKYPYGIIASGFNDGSVGLWDANTIIKSTATDDNNNANGRGLLCLQNIHSVPVQTIAFNPNRQHLIASGGVEVAIHNLEQDIADPDVFSPGDNLHEGSVITSVSWNRKVPNILASASQNGISVVWDLKHNKSIFNFSDHSRNLNNRNVSLSWNPEIPTQIAVAYDDEKTPELQIWDLRNPKGPIFCSMKGHTKGIHYLDWCLTDPALIITLGRDNKTCIWNYKQGDSLVSESAVTEPCSSVQWSPRQPEIYSTASASGKSTIYSLNNQIDHIPIWLRPPVGARFSFDGRLAVFSEKGGVQVREYTTTPAEDELLPYINDFEQNFTSSQLDILKLCDNRLNSQFLDDTEKEEWKFIKAVAGSSVDDILKVLGLDKDKIIKQAEEYTSKIYARKDSTHKVVDYNFLVPSQQEAEDLFAAFAQQTSKKESPQKQSYEDPNAEREVIVKETIAKNTNWNAGKEKLIKDSILIGNIEGAVDTALRVGRVAEAFLLAYAKGADFFRTTVESFVTSSNDPFIKTVIKSLFEDQITDLVNKYPLEDWKECVALCLSLSKGVDSVFRHHMDELALRFSKLNDHNTALLCYILSKNFLRILETFAFRTETFQKGSIDHTIFLLRTIEKLVALKIVTNNLEPNSIVDRFIFELTKVLHSYNKDGLILNLLAINNSSGFECLILRDRILGSNVEFTLTHAPKAFPLHHETVNIKHRKAPAHPTHPEKKPISHGEGFGGHQTGFQQQQMQHPPGPGPQPGRPVGPGPVKPGTRPTAFTPSGPSADTSHQQFGAPPNVHGSQQFGGPPRNEPPKSFPPPTTGPKPGVAPFNPATRREEVPPPSFGGKPGMMDTSQTSHAFPPSSTQASFSSTQRGGFDHPPHDTHPPQEPFSAGPKTTPFAGPPSTHASHAFPQQTFEEQPAPPIQQPRQVSQPKPQPPSFKGPSMPKPLTGPGPMKPQGPTGTAMPGPGGSQMGAPPGGPTGGPMGGPPTTHGGPTGGPSAGGPMGGPPGRSGPPTGMPKPGGLTGPPPITNPPSGQHGGPSQHIGGPPTGGMSAPLSGPSGGYGAPPSGPSGGYGAPPSGPSGGYGVPPSGPGGSFGGQPPTGGPMGGPSTGGPGLNQGFKPQQVPPGRVPPGPGKMPPKPGMPGMPGPGGLRR